MAEKLPYNHPLNPPYKKTSGFWFRSDGFHRGVDWAPLTGHDLLLRFVSSGRVLSEGWHSKSGWYVWYEANYIDGRKYKILYAHMAHQSPLKAGDKFDAGQWAGTIGKTGYATGVHVHIEILDDDGVPRDPELWLENHRLISEIRKVG